MIQMIPPTRLGEFSATIQRMYILRYRVFKQRLNWDVSWSTLPDGQCMEMDTYDTLSPTYLVYRGSDDAVLGCMRLLPTTGPYMLRDTFPQLLGGKAAPVSPRVWDVSRFAVDTRSANGVATARGVLRATAQLVCGVFEAGLSQEVEQLAVVVDTGFLKILRRCGVEVRPYTDPKPVGDGLAVGGLIDVSPATLARVRDAGQIREPVLWTPALPAAA